MVLVRYIETYFLDTEAIRVAVDNPANLHWRKMDMRDKRITAKDHGILTAAKGGNFSKLKIFVKSKAEAFEDIAADYIEGDPENQRFLRIGRNLGLISENWKNIKTDEKLGAIAVPNDPYFLSTLGFKFEFIQPEVSN